MERDKYFSVKLHERKDLMTECALVLNEEWPRSLTARCLMLEKSNDQFPYCIVLLEKGNIEGKAKVVGHSRLCKVYGQDDACFVESVVVSKNMRGKGLGRILMDESEKHAKLLGCETLYLTTHDKQDFYAHLDFVYCQPIVSLGSASKLISDEMAKTLFSNLNISGSATDVKSSQSTNDIERTSNTLHNNDSAKNCHSETSMNSSTIPPPPPPPPPPGPFVPPPPPPPNASTKTNKKEVSRLDPQSVHWMKKTLAS